MMPLTKAGSAFDTTVIMLTLLSMTNNNVQGPRSLNIHFHMWECLI
jgi:hypothetical protein